MPHQLIFTSSVRGIKPGASGYCTVLRSPGIRPSLERALEGFSVFEHIDRNVGNCIQSLRHLELRGVNYYVLSRVGDAGKDYTGRTNFIAHYLVFEANELPEASPVDILLNWGGWCHAWSGEPREETVDGAALANVTRLQVPAVSWQQQPCGVSPAVTLATGDHTKALIKSMSLAPEGVLQLLGEAFAVRAQLLRDHTSSWRTPFSVGLASDSHAKDFTWIGAYWEPEASLLRSRELIDVSVVSADVGGIDAKALAIAQTGRYIEAPKPIQLTQNPEMRSVLNQALEETRDVPQHSTTRKGRNPPIRRQPGKGGVKQCKKRSKLPLFIVAVVLLLTGVVFFVWNGQKETKANDQQKAQYQETLQRMLDLDQQILDEYTTDPEEVVDVLRELAERHPNGNDGQAGESPEFYSEWFIKDAVDYQNAFKRLNDYNRRAHEAGDALSSDQNVFQRSQARAAARDGAIRMAGDSSAEREVAAPVTELKVSPVEDSPAPELIFKKVGLVVYFAKVGGSFPLSRDQLLDSKGSVMRGFLSKAPLTESDFSEKATYAKRKQHSLSLRCGEISSSIDLRKLGESDSEIAVLIETKEGQRNLVLIYGENSTALELDYKLEHERSAKATYGYLRDVFDVEAYGGGAGLVLYDGETRYDYLEQVRVGRAGLDGNKAVDAALKKYALPREGISMALIEKKVAEEVIGIIEKRIDALKKSDDKDKDPSLAISKLQELISLLKSGELKIEGLSTRIEELKEKVEVPLGESVSDSEDRRSKRAIAELGGISQMVSNQTQDDAFFGLSHDLTQVVYKQYKNSKFEKKSWQYLSDEVQKYVTYSKAKAEREEKKEEYRMFSEEKKAFTTLEIRDGSRVLAEIKLEYSK